MFLYLIRIQPSAQKARTIGFRVAPADHFRDEIAPSVHVTIVEHRGYTQLFDKVLTVCCICAAFIPVKPSVSQQVRVGVQGEISVGELAEMESMLTLATLDQKVGLLTRLGVEAPVVTDITEHLIPGERIRLRSVRSRGPAHYGVAFLPSGAGVFCYLYLLQKEDVDSAKMPWHVIDQRQLDCWAGASSLELIPLRDGREDALLLHDVTAGHGSGLLLKEAQIFSVVNGKLQETLRTEDYHSEDHLAADERVIKRSTFLRFPDDTLEETRTSSINDKLQKVERRYWRWSEEQQKFIANGFQKVAAEMP
jgi:hypothetical protein